MRSFLSAAMLAGGPLILALSAVAANAPALAQTTCSDGQNRWLHVQNLRPVAIYLLQHRMTYSSGEWGGDVLGDTATPPGSTVYVQMPSADCRCRADMLVTMESGTNRQLTYNNVNYCSAANGVRARLVVD